MFTILISFLRFLMTLNLNMLSLYTSFIFVSFILKTTYCQRRIVNGTASVGEPTYLAYFVKTAKSNVDYTGWVCGGCIVHPLYILTSAACLADVQDVYAIAGYKKYIRSEKINRDSCTSRIKKRVVSKSYQKDYNLNDYKPGNWNSRDISLAKVESPYDFRDPVYTAFCSYPPEMIRVNYNSNFEEAGTQAVTFGWGHKKYFRLEGNEEDYNEKIVNYASTVVIDKNSCKDKLYGHEDIKMHVDLYLICTLGPGDLDETGQQIETSTLFNISNNCDEALKKNNINDTIEFYDPNSQFSTISNQVDYRRHGPCQNDHGGPLVTWIGGREYVIGVASGFQVNKDMECVGPFLYTSTFSNGEFLYCILRYSRHSKLCDTPPSEKGFEIVEDEVVTDNVSEGRFLPMLPASLETFVAVLATLAILPAIFISIPVWQNCRQFSSLFKSSTSENHLTCLNSYYSTQLYFDYESI